MKFLAKALTLAALGLTFVNSPALARRSVIDVGITNLSGYCSPAEIGLSDCAPVLLPFSINMGRTLFNSFVTHSNGLVSFGSAIDFSTPFIDLSSYGVPVFSPLFDNSDYFSFRNYQDSVRVNDGVFVSDYFITPDSVQIRWMRCITAGICGPQSKLDTSGGGPGEGALRLAAQQKSFFGLTLIRLNSGFSVDFSYGNCTDTYCQSWTGVNAPLGFSLPGAAFQSNGPTANRSFLFDASGALVNSAVPEPATWAMIIVGFGLVGGAMRQKRTRLAKAGLA